MKNDAEFIKNKEELRINGEWVTPHNLAQWAEGKTGILAEVAAFLEEWFDPGPTVLLHTSGSTGKPARLEGGKEHMRASARLSCRFFALNPGDTALLALPLRYIAGKMMVVRALTARLCLKTVDPSSTPLDELSEPVDFAPLIPMQAARTLSQPGGESRLALVRTLLLGGGFIDGNLEKALQAIPSRIFASYGMTETFSHIALRRVNGPERSDLYVPLPGISIRSNSEGLLSLSAPHLGIANLDTHDFAEVSADGRFLPRGRADAVINSGGIKIQAEDIERHIHDSAGLSAVAVPVPHPELGQCVALLWEGEAHAETDLLAACQRLPRYHRPRYVQRLEQLPRTDTGKIARGQCACLAASQRDIPLTVAEDFLNQPACAGNETPWLALAPALTESQPEQWLDATHITNITRPQIKICFPRHWSPTGRVPVLCVIPGGGYAMEAIHKEGVHVARWAAGLGMIGITLKYRVSSEAGASGSFPIPLQETFQTLEFIRRHAARLGADPKRTGLMGFSAGAHLAAMAATLWNSPRLEEKGIKAVGKRPDFAMLIYPVISMAPSVTHLGSRRQLLGDAPRSTEERLCSAEKNVTMHTPPLFLVQALDDSVSPRNSELMEQACRAAGVPVRRIVYPSGGHGYGMERRGAPTDAWPQEAEFWLRDRGILRPCRT